MRGKLENPTPRDPFQYVLNLEANLHSLLSFAWTLTRPTNYWRQNIVFSYPEMIRVSFSLFLSFSVFCYFTLLLAFIKIILLLFIYFCYYFFHENYFYFFVFRNVPECSVFRVLSTPIPSKLSAIDIIQYMFVPQFEYFIKLVTGDDFSLLILILKNDLRLNMNRIDFSP